MVSDNYNLASSKKVGSNESNKVIVQANFV